MSISKKVFITLLSILMALCLGLIAWWSVIMFTGADKIVRNTFYVGNLTTAEGQEKPFMEVNYYSNKNKNGFEMLEMNFTYFTDEGRATTYSQGIQYVASAPENSIEFDHYIVSTTEEVSTRQNFLNGFFGLFKNYSYLVQAQPGENTEYYNYASADDFKSVSGTIKPLNIDSEFLVNIDEGMYLLKFKGLNSPRELENEFSSYETPIFANYCYYFYDHNFLGESMLEAMKTASLGEGTFVFEYGDLFDYYKFNDGQWSEVITDKTAYNKLVSSVTTYFSIKVNVSNDGATSAEDSMFGMLHGSSTYDLNGGADDSYFTGKTKIDLTLSNFDLLIDHDNYVKLRLKKSFIEEFAKYKNRICIEVVIDLDKLSSLGYEFAGFEDLGDFEVYKLYTQKLQDGESVKSEVML